MADTGTIYQSGPQPETKGIFDRVDLDPRFRQIRQEEISAWVKENGSIWEDEEKQIFKNEFLTFVFGDPNEISDGKKPKSLNDRVLEQFKKENPQKYEQYVAKIYDNPADDPEFVRIEEQIQDRANTAFEEAVQGKEIKDPISLWREFYAKESIKGWTDFLKESPKKAESYKDSYTPLSYAYEKSKDPESTNPHKKGLVTHAYIMASLHNPQNGIKEQTTNSLEEEGKPIEFDQYLEILRENRQAYVDEILNIPGMPIETADSYAPSIPAMGPELLSEHVFAQVNEPAPSLPIPSTPNGSLVGDFVRSTGDKVLSKVSSKITSEAKKKFGKAAVKKATGKAVEKAVEKGTEKAVQWLARVGLSEFLGPLAEAVGRVLGKVAAKLSKYVGKISKGLATLGAGLLLGGLLMGSPAMMIGGALGIGIGGPAALTAGLAQTGAFISSFFVAVVLPSIAIPFIVSIFTVIITMALIIFIITSGAFMVPGAEPISALPPGAGGAINPGPIASGSCPLTGDYDITSPSYDPTAETGHGSNLYWSNGQGGYRNDACGYRIPVPGTAGMDCYGPDTSAVPAAAGNICAEEESVCPYYGYAVDVAPRPDNEPARPVVVPFLCEEGSNDCPAMTWKATRGWYNCQGGVEDTREECVSSGRNGWGYGVQFVASGNGHNWKVYIIHIDPLDSMLDANGRVITGGSFESGEQIGVATEDLDPTHIHVELAVDGTAQKPDFMCGGEVIPVPSPPPDTQKDGWVIESNSAFNFLASKPLEFGRNTCDWARNSGRYVDYAVNANLYNSIVDPIKPAGYRDNNDFGGIYLNGENNTGFDTNAFVIYKNGNIAVFNPENVSINYSAVRLAVAGIDLTQNGLPQNKEKRTVLGWDGNESIFLMVLRSATPNEAKEAMIKEGGTQAQIMLNSGDATTLCTKTGSGYDEVFPETQSGVTTVANSIGVSGGEIREIELE